MPQRIGQDATTNRPRCHNESAKMPQRIGQDVAERVEVGAKLEEEEGGLEDNLKEVNGDRPAMNKGKTAKSCLMKLRCANPDKNRYPISKYDWKNANS
jgi:hypothetical protein